MSLEKVSEILERMTAFACPHCGAGHDERTVGLVWDPREQCWRCLICGFREYEQAASPPLVDVLLPLSTWPV